MAQVLFDRLKSNLAQCINDGTIYFVKDSNGNFTQIALGDGSKSHVVGIGPNMDDTTKQELMSKLGLTTSANMGTIQLGKLSNNNDVSSQKVVTYERTGLGTDTHEISTVGYVHQYMKTAKAMVYAGLFNAQTKEITDYNTAIISPSQEGNVTFDYLLNGNEGETLLTPGMSFIVGTAGDLEGYTGISIYGGETKVEVGDMIIIINVEQKGSVEGGSTYNEASILVIQNTNFKIADGAVTSEKIATSAFDDTLSVSGKIAPADIVGGKLSELDEQINGNYLAQATQIYLGSYSSSGGYTQAISQGYFFVDVKSFRGQSITCDSSLVIQYAFFKDFTPGQKTTLADGTSRVTGKPVAVTIPQDADVLYLYIGTSITAPIPVVSVTGEMGGIVDNIQEIEDTATEAKELSQDNGKKIYELTPYVNKVKDLGWSYVFNGTSSVATLSSPIVLENDGDSIEFDDIEIETYTPLNGYGFAKGGHSSMVGITVYYDTNNGYYTVYVRADDGTFIFQKQIDTKLIKFKLSYEGGNILLTFNDTNVFTYQGQKKLTLLAFGKGAPSYGYWKGVIGTIFVNGESYDLFQNATQTDISIDNINGFLSTEQANLLNRQQSNSMYAEKTATLLKVYCKLPNGKYVGYPLTYRQKSYTDGQYPSFYDNWGILKVGIYDKTANGMQLISQIFQDGEAEMAINATSGISSAFVYVGGSVHGFENIMSDTNGRCISFLVDNQKISETDSFSLRSVGRVEVLQKSEICQAYTNSNPFAEALKNWIWDNEGFRIKTSVKITRSVAIHMAQLGMFCVYRRWNGDTSQSYLTNRAIKNNLPFEVFNVEDDWDIAELKAADYGCTKITEYGEMGYGFSMEIKDANTRSNGGMFVHNNGTGKYNKIYYANCNDFSPNVGDELNATQVWSIEG